MVEGEGWLELRCVKDIPAFVGTDMKEYAGAKADEVCSYPPKIASLLLERHLVEPFLKQKKGNGGRVNRAKSVKELPKKPEVELVNEKVELQIPKDLIEFVSEESKHYKSVEEFILTVLRNEKVCLKDFDG